MNLHPVLTDKERFPLIENQEFLKNLRQDSTAPLYNFKSGDRLTRRALLSVKQYAKERIGEPFWHEKELPTWMHEYINWCIKTVPAYKEYPSDFHNIPSIKREDITSTPWNFVSDECDIDELLVYSTSGTTGVPMDVLFDAASQASWIPQMESVLAREGITLEGGNEKVSICLICSQDTTLTYASMSTYLNGAGVLKINLNPKDWHHPDDRKRYLEKYNPEIITGDPFAFLALANLKPDIYPKALVSSAMKITQGVRDTLEALFHCPVFDIYSLTECRMIAYSMGETHHLIRPDLYIEILDPKGDKVLPMGEIGEITITGGNNPFLPLIRYRTGDFASLEKTVQGYKLVSFDGREATVFKTVSGKFLNNVDISRALCDFVLSGYTLHQNRDTSLVFEGWGENLVKTDILTCLKELFGTSVKIDITLNDGTLFRSKKINYTSAFTEGDMA